MKNLKSIITIIAISLATTFSTSAIENEPTKVIKKLRTELVSMLGDKIQMELNESTSAKISFIINNHNEVVIISVDSKFNEIHSFVKNKLNYKKVKVKGVVKGEIYSIPVKINA